MHLTQRVRERSGCERTHDRLRKRAVEREIDLGNAGRRCEAAFIGSVIAAKRANIVQRPHLATHEPIAGNQIRAGGAVRLGLKHGLIEAWGKRIEQVDIAGELAVFLFGDASGHEDPEVPDLVVDRVDDGLPVRADIVDVVVEIENPV